MLIGNQFHSLLRSCFDPSGGSIYESLSSNRTGRRQWLLSFILLLSCLSLSAQFYETGQDPASLKWVQIKTGRFTVIYPESYGRGGIEFARSLDASYRKLTTLFPDKKFRIPVIIHNYTVQSNGYVAWAPKRVELYPTPEQNSIPLASTTQLTAHELTHVLQMESLEQGFSKWMSLLLGQQFPGLISSLLPQWFLEGDAVFAETILTQSGRGRSAAFQKEVNALLSENRKKFKYDKVLNGSFRDFVPDYYETGYQMVTLSLTKSDPLIWNKVLKFTAEQPFTLNPVNISLKADARTTKRKLWDETSDSLRAMWGRSSGSKQYRVMNSPKSGRYINYHSPVMVSHDSIIALKTSLSEPLSFVLINPEKNTEKRIHVPGLIFPYFITASKNALVWVETKTDPRWANREYSVLRSMDLKTGRTRKLSAGSRYLTAAVSPRGDVIAAVENTVDNINNLVFLDAATGEIKMSVKPPDNIYLQHPQWEPNGKRITFISLTQNGEGIVSYSPGEHRWETLLEPGRNDLQSSFIRNDSLYFISSASGTDNVFVKTNNSSPLQVTLSRFGASDVTPAGNSLLFSDYTSKGNNICTTGGRTAHSEIKNASSFLIDRLQPKIFADQNDTLKYEVTPYRKWQHLFRFHSWMPFYANITDVNIDPESVRPGITLLSQNTLSTLTSIIGYEYSAEKRHVFHSRFKWSGWYPVIESQIDYGAIPGIHKLGETVADPLTLRPALEFLNTISIPLQFQSGRFSEFIQPSIATDYLNQYIYLRDKNLYDYGQTIVTGRFYVSNYYRRAFRDIYPRWAQVADFNYCFAPFDREIYGSAISLKTAFYFPGLFRTHGIKIRLEAEKQETEKYLYRNFSTLPRGYSDIIAKEIRFVSVDYVMPVVYPDFNLGSLLYLKRIRAGLFYDYAEGPGNSLYKSTPTGLAPIYNTTHVKSFSSFGFELLADFHLLRIPNMISSGIQSAWKSINESPSVGVIFTIDLYGMSINRKKI